MQLEMALTPAALSREFRDGALFSGKRQLQSLVSCPVDLQFDSHHDPKLSINYMLF